MLFLLQFFIFYVIIIQAFPVDIFDDFLAKNDSTDPVERIKDENNEDGNVQKIKKEEEEEHQNDYDEDEDDDDGGPSSFNSSKKRWHFSSEAWTKKVKLVKTNSNIKVEHPSHAAGQLQSDADQQWHSSGSIGIKAVKREPKHEQLVIRIKNGEIDQWDDFEQDAADQTKCPKNDQQCSTNENSRRQAKQQSSSYNACNDDAKNSDQSSTSADSGGSDDANQPLSSRQIHGYTNEEKIEIVKKFMKIKKAWGRQKMKKTLLNGSMINQRIAAHFGVSATTIYRWKKEYGIRGVGVKATQCQQQTDSNVVRFTDEEKKRILKNYLKLKKDNSFMTDVQIAQALGIGRSSLNQWKNQFAIGQAKIDEKNEQKKMEMLHKYNKLKLKHPHKYDNELAKMLQIGVNKLSNIKKKYDRTFKKKYYSDNEKIKLLKKCAKIKQRHPELNQKEIGKLLKISKKSIARWRQQFANQTNESENDENNDNTIMTSNNRHGINFTHLDAQLFAADQKIWEWNQATKKRS